MNSSEMNQIPLENQLPPNDPPRPPSPDADQECPVCYNHIYDNPPLPCGHNLCADCEVRIKAMERWEAGARRCPLCRAALPALEVPANLPPPPADARILRLRALAATMNQEERLYRRLQRQQASLQTQMTNLTLAIGRDAQEWNNLLANDITGTTSTFGNTLIQNPNPALFNRLRDHPVVQVAPVMVAAPVQPVPQPLPPPVAAQPAVVQGGHKCGHRGCERHGTGQGVRFRRMSDGRRLFRCEEHTF